MQTDIENITHQYLTFQLGDEVFSFDISKVREVLDLVNITKVPRTPDFMRGVINLRGSVVPVIDVKLRFGQGVTEKTVNTCIIIVEVDLKGETLILGALADSVREVIEIQPSSIEPPPKIGTMLDTAFIKGMGKHNDDFVIILDIDRIFSDEELAAVAEAAKTE